MFHFGGLWFLRITARSKAAQALHHKLTSGLWRVHVAHHLTSRQKQKRAVSVRALRTASGRLHPLSSSDEESLRSGIRCVNLPFLKSSTVCLRRGELVPKSEKSMSSKTRRRPSKKRHSPSLQDFFRRNARGKGIYERYQAWCQITRSDPGSQGLSSIEVCYGRSHDFLSTGETIGFLFCTLMPEVIDVREQFPLSLEAATHESREYVLPLGYTEPSLYMGTFGLAHQLRMRHPRTWEKGRSDWWVMTTDLLVTLSTADGIQLLAISIKPDIAELTPRERQLLDLERTYWEIRDIPWLLITQSTYSLRTANRLQEYRGYALKDPVCPEDLTIAAKLGNQYAGLPLHFAWLMIARHFGKGIKHAKNAFWQAVWQGQLCIDLDRPVEPTERYHCLTREAFLALNPVASRRTASWA
jgi:hypothetical protein